MTTEQIEALFNTAVEEKAIYNELEENFRETIQLAQAVAQSQVLAIC
jgi:hypothetical protein